MKIESQLENTSFLSRRLQTPLDHLIFVVFPFALAWTDRVMTAGAKERRALH